MNYCYYYVGDVQLSQRDHTAGCIIVFAKNEILQLEDNMLHTLYIYIEPLWYNHLESVLNLVKTWKITAITEFKVIQGDRGWYELKAPIRFAISD